MSSIEKMEFVNITGFAGELDNVLVKLSECGFFHIEPAAKVTGNIKGFNILKEENPYAATVKLLSDLGTKLGIKYENADYSDIADISVRRINSYLKSLHEKTDVLKAKQLEITENLKTHNQAVSQLIHLQGLNVDLQQIFALRYIKVRFGRLPVDSYEKFPYYDDKLFFFIRLSAEKEFLWGLYFTPADCSEEIDEIFDSLFFERVRIPDFVHGNTADGLKLASEMAEEDRLVLENILKELNAVYENEKTYLNKLFSKFKTQHDNFALRNKASVINNKFFIVGFIPTKEYDEFHRMFDNMPGISLVLQPADNNGKLAPPIKLRNNKFSEPFSMFVDMYGLPSYNGINPTTLVAVTYVLLFGIMFGDLGQGIIISVLGALLWRYKRFSLGPIMARIGISSAVFGLLFGSVFGFEELLDPLYEKLGIPFLPFRAMENINAVLYGAIIIGVAVIFISIIINIIIGLKNKDLIKSLFGNNGIAGFVFFGSLLSGLVFSLFEIKLFTAPYVIFLIVLPVMMMFLREPLSHWVSGKAFHLESGIGDFIASNFFEVFEFMLGYATNTLSFVRIGGFVLSHAGMMSVVMALAESASAGASPFIIIIGNIFVMAMEGMIVGIQVLRLEFYEIFSRFYNAEGQPFTPVRINYNENDY